MRSIKAAAKSALPNICVELGRTIMSRLARRVSLVRYTRRIRDTFPQLKFRRTKLIQSGFDFEVLVVDNKTIFRFPRSERCRLSLIQEMKLLNHLEGAARVRIPHYRYVDPGGGFGGYPIISGQELRLDVFRALDLVTQQSVLQQLAGFLSVLHGLDPHLIQQPGKIILDLWNDPRFSHCDFERRLDVFVAAVDRPLIEAMERFFADHGQPIRSPFRVVHSDVTEDHVLFSSDDRRIGLIDFSDTTLGDPAWDFASIGSYADWVGPYLLDHYAFANEDPGLLDRSREQAVRYWTERLYNHLTGVDIGQTTAGISAMLRLALTNVQGRSSRSYPLTQSDKD